MLSERAAGRTITAGRITAAVNMGRRSAWAGIAARHGALPGVRLADQVLEGVTCIRLDASVTCHSDKELAEPNFKGMLGGRSARHGADRAAPRRTGRGPAGRLAAILSMSRVTKLGPLDLHDPPA